VKVTNSSASIGAGGVCYSNGTGMGRNPIRPCIIVRVSPNEKGYPYRTNYRSTKCEKTEYQKINEKTGETETWYRKKYVDNPGGSTGGYINCLILNKDEAIINLMAHEFRDFWQVNHRTRRRKVWGSRGKMSDRDADAYAIRKMREWRRLVSPKQVYPEVPW
jgi:hypothetical protein